MRKPRHRGRLNCRPARQCGPRSAETARTIRHFFAIRRGWIGLFSCLLFASAASAQVVPQPAVGTNARPSITVPRGPLPVFALYSNFWVNLHHVLYEQARWGTGRQVVQRQRNGERPLPTPLSLDGLNDKERQDWNAAIDEY